MNVADRENRSDDDMLVVSGRIKIPISEFRFSFARSSGPGGQNVNKVNTKARLHWDFAGTTSLNNDVKQRFRQKYRRRISADGELQIVSQRFRDQSRNVDDCLEKLRQLLIEVATPPKPRKKTRPSRASKERRLSEKRQQAERKQRRQRPRLDD